MTAAQRAELDAIGAGGPNFDENSSSQMNGTLVIVDGVETNLRYLVGVRNRGHGSRRGTPHNFRVNLPGDRPWEERTALSFNARSVHSQLVGSIAHRVAGNPAGETVAVQLRINGDNLAQSGGHHMFGSYVLVEEKDGNFAANHFLDDDGGNLYSAFRTDYTPQQEADLRYEGPNPHAYRDTYFKETNSQEDDWSDLIHMLDVLNNLPAS